MSRFTHCSKLSHPVSLPTEGSTPLFLTVKGPKLSSIQTSACWTGTTELSLPSRCRSPSQGPTWIGATLHWNRLYSLSHQECYFKLVDATDTKSIKRLKKQGLEREEQQSPLKGREREGPELTLEGLSLFLSSWQRHNLP